jgi:hypothetical protein
LNKIAGLINKIGEQLFEETNEKSCQNPSVQAGRFISDCHECGYNTNAMLKTVSAQPRSRPEKCLLTPR